MFKKEVYIERRKKLHEKMQNGLALIFGNSESPMNYPSNTYHFRQDSSFLYFFGLDYPDFIGVLDIDNGTDYIFGNDIDLEDIIWMGEQPSLSEKSFKCGVEHTAPLNDVKTLINNAITEGRQIHYLPPYRAERRIQIENLLGIHHSRANQYASTKLIKAVVDIVSYKDQYEVEEMDRTLTNVTKKMYETALLMAKEGVSEQTIAGRMEGIAMENGGQVAYPIILSTNGQILHNHHHHNILKNGDLLLIDAGAESPMRYATDITRTYPVGGKFSQKQREIYEIVLKAEMESIEMLRPGIEYRTVHLNAAKIIASGLKELGLMKGDVEEAVKQGAHAMFFPHGLGHMIGLNVHDMEDIGEKFVGYNNETVRSTQFGTAYLRLGRKLEEGFVITVEPGIYFIPALIETWKKEGKFNEFINYEKVEEYLDFGGIRIEDDVLITANGHKVLGERIPKTIEEIEEFLSK